MSPSATISSRLVELEPRTIASLLLDAADAAGAAEVEVEVRATTRREFSYGSGGRRRSGPTERIHCSLRVRDERGARGLVQLEPGVRQTAATFAKKAMAAAARAKPDPDDRPAGRLDVRDRGLGILDIRQENITDADRAEVPQDNMEAVEGIADGIVADSFRYVEDELERIFLSSSGQLSTERSTRFSLAGNLRDTVRDVGFSDSLESRHFADVASVPLSVNMAQRLASFREAAELPEAPTTLVLDPIAVARLLRAMVPAFSAEAIEAGKSFLAGRMGERIGSAKLHILDDPGLAGALRTRAFDERGVPPMALPLLREGMSGSSYLGPALAAARDQRPTGHSRADGSLWPGNLMVRAGTRSRNMLLPDKGPHVGIEDILDPSGIDPVAGTIDVPVRALAMDGPTVVGCAGERRLRCTIEELLLSVDDICNDQVRIRDVDACTWICEDGPTLT